LTRSRTQRVARLERLAPRYFEILERLQAAAGDKLANQAVIHLTNLAVLSHFGNPTVGEPLSTAWERCDLGPWKRTDFPTPFDPWAARFVSSMTREVFIPKLPGPDEKERIQLIIASAPPWLVWFTYGDVTADVLGLKVPDLSDMRKFARSASTLRRLPALPSGPFKYRPWPDGSDDEPITAEELALLRKELAGITEQMTPRERRRAMKLYVQLGPIEPRDKSRPWPSLG
jgi:hypothetical protein